MAGAIEIVESELVFPSEQTPKLGLWLSNLDILHAPKSPTPVIYVYPPSGHSDSFKVEALKLGLSKALVPYYPLAGRVDKGPDGRFEINCNGRGALFVVARKECSIEEFGDLAPSPEMRKMLAPSIPSDDPAIVFMAQVTFFKSGEVILGTTCNHLAGDAISITSFIRSWSKMTRGITELDVPPFHDRTLLRARPQPRVQFDHIGSTQQPPLNPARSPSVSFTFKLSRSQLDLLKTSSSNKKPTTFRAVAAHLWKCMCSARGLARDQETRLYFSVDVRGRMSPQLPEGFFGNALSRMAAVASVDGIISNPIDFAADKIADEIKRVDDEYVRSLIDHLEVNMVDRVPGARETDFGVVSWLRMPFYDADFGWGKPEIVRRASIPLDGLAYIMDSPLDDGGVWVSVVLEDKSMEKLKVVFYKELELILLE